MPEDSFKLWLANVQLAFHKLFLVWTSMARRCILVVVPPNKVSRQVTEEKQLSHSITHYTSLPRVESFKRAAAKDTMDTTTKVKIEKGGPNWQLRYG
jgi:hypothetical protein